MEQKKSTVRTAIYKKSGNGQYGEYHIHEITFDNGDKGDYMAKTNPQNTFTVGQEAEYTIEKRENGQYVNFAIKPVKQANGFVPNKGNPVYEHKRTALRCAVELCAHGKITTDKIGEWAGNFMKFLNE